MTCEYCRETQEPILHRKRWQCPTCGAPAKPPVLGNSPGIEMRFGAYANLVTTLYNPPITDWQLYLLS